ncbi:MAG: T9SS type A sorting domain-containing protein [Paludibacteraceae bacterium]|nr:T9SS type A sorting domain-containing protein [Paludibacteraceae bacterium]
MKKQLFNILLCCLAVLPLGRTMAQSTVVDGQSTEGKDFWVTFMQADQDPNNDLTLSLSISSREDCQVTITNPFTGYSENVNVTANQMKLVELYSGNVLVGNARSAMESSKKTCYAVYSEKVDTCALHVTATKNIALFATNYKRATFDATNVLPTASLLDEYVIQTYTPSDHGGKEKTQGSHFAIIAAEDNTIVDYVPTERTQRINQVFDDAANNYYLSEEDSMIYNTYQLGDTLHTPVLKKGQVWYVWTGKRDNTPGDLSGTFVKARNGKKIAVFQGCPHTNIPYQTKERDHIFSQAMPTQYWGNTFVLTASAGRHKDYIRVLALNDGTEVRINGNLVHTFNFASERKHYWEFTIGDQGTYAQDGSCIVTTSCPCAVHLFMASKNADGVSDGDPAMLWVNPIEQQIDQVTFATYSSKNGTTAHYVNVVTDQPDKMTLDGTSIASSFKSVSGSSTYKYAQVSLGNAAASHTLKSEGSNFIAHVYGFTSNESYGYSAGGATKPLTQYITINGQIFSPDTENTLCGEDTIKFACHPDYEYQKIEWYFGDGTNDLTNKDSVLHYYENSGSYAAYVLIYRESSNVCVGQNAIDSIPITVTIGRYQFSIDDIDIPCPEDGKAYIGKVFYSNEGHVNLHGENVTIEFDDVARADGFRNDQLVINDSYFQITIPATAKPETLYGIHLVIVSDCGGADTTMNFMVNFDKDVITQRYNNVLGLLASSFDGKELSDFQWYRVSDSTAVEGQVSANLNFYDLPNGEFENDTYYVCFTINKGQSNEVRTCACAKAFIENSQSQSFAADSTDLTITATYALQAGGKIFVNADWKGETDLECYAKWIDANGRVYQDLQFDIPDGGCTIDAPAESGLYLLYVKTGKGSRSFKFIINN